MPASATGPWSELAHRGGDGLDVTLMWARRRAAHRVRVCDRRAGAYLELEPAPHVFHHPYGSRTSSTLDDEDRRLAGVGRAGGRS